MLRDKTLIPLSHQHQHALALCVRIERAVPIPEADLPAWQSEIAEIFRAEIATHFDAEEKVIFPAALPFDALAPLIGELLDDHVTLRQCFATAEDGLMDAAGLSAFSARLTSHIRKEERQLFERMQELMGPENLAALGAELEAALKNATQICAVQNARAKPSPGK